MNVHLIDSIIMNVCNVQTFLELTSAAAMMATTIHQLLEHAMVRGNTQINGSYWYTMYTNIQFWAPYLAHTIA
jgi:hypothetical protein